MSEINIKLFGDFDEKMSKIKEKYKKNMPKFVELCNKQTKDIIAICERYLKDKCLNNYLLDSTRSEGSTKTFDIRYSNVNNSKWEPYDIIYRIAYYDNLELKINPCGVTIFEQMEHCAGLETHKEDFETFESTYNVNNEIRKMNWETDFTNEYEDYKKIIGTTFVNYDKTVAVRVVGVPANPDNYKVHGYEFLYEEFYGDDGEDWVYSSDYNWLIESNENDPFYKQFVLTDETRMNIGSENMYHLGKDGNLYTTVECGDDYFVFTPISDEEGNKIREFAIKDKETWD
jgi:hypothetical protein